MSVFLICSAAMISSTPKSPPSYSSIWSENSTKTTTVGLASNVFGWQRHKTGFWLHRTKWGCVFINPLASWSCIIHKALSSLPFKSLKKKDRHQQLLHFVYRLLEAILKPFKWVIQRKARLYSFGVPALPSLSLFHILVLSVHKTSLV